MGYFPVRYDSRVIIYERKMFIRLATGEYHNELYALPTSTMGGGCGSVEGAVTSKTRGLQFESGHRQIFMFNIYFTVNCWNADNIEKRSANGPFLSTQSVLPILTQNFIITTYLPTYIHTYVIDYNTSNRLAGKKLFEHQQQRPVAAAVLALAINQRSR